ncbi:MAG: hypothetical protein ACI4TS_05255 [Bacteroidaceae bacterium]
MSRHTHNLSRRLIKIACVWLSALFATWQPLCAQTDVALPLKPIDKDSIYMMDFFWEGIQHKADSIAAKTPLYHKKNKKITSAEIKNLTQRWETTTANLKLTGEEKNKPTTLAASIKLFNDSYHLFHQTGKAKYLDVAERVLANSILKLWQTDSDRSAQQETTELLRNIDKLAYSISGKDVYVNMLMRTNAHIKNKDIDIYLQSVNSSPWYNETAITFVPNLNPFQFNDSENVGTNKKIIHTSANLSADSCEVTFHIRIPSWATGNEFLRGYEVKPFRSKTLIMVNGITRNRPEMKDGFIIIKGKWALGDIITIKTPTPILRISDPLQPGMVALQRGPFIYGITTTDDKAILSPDSKISQSFSKTDNAVALYSLMDDNGNRLYALPYYISAGKSQLFIPSK